LVAAELGHEHASACFGKLLDKDDPHLFGLEGLLLQMESLVFFLNEMVDQIRNFSCGTGHAKIAFVIGRALEGQIDNEKRTLFGNPKRFDTCIVLANQALHFTNFNCSRIGEQSLAGQLLGRETKL
jgi:hypothetical protein